MPTINWSFYCCSLIVYYFIISLLFSGFLIKSLMPSLRQTLCLFFIFSKLLMATQRLKFAQIMNFYLTSQLALQIHPVINIFIWFAMPFRLFNIFSCNFCMLLVILSSASKTIVEVLQTWLGCFEDLNAKFIVSLMLAVRSQIFLAQIL